MSAQSGCCASFFKNNRRVIAALLGALWALLFSTSSNRAQVPIEQLYREARAAVERRDFAQAEREYQEITQRAPWESKAYHNLGVLFFWDSKYRDAAAALEKGVQIDPNQAGSWILLGRAYYGLHEDAKAASSLGEALRLKPDDPEAMLYLGKARTDAGDYQAAADVLSRLAKLEPSDPEVMQALSAAYMKITLNAAGQKDAVEDGKARDSAQLEAITGPERGDYKGAVEYYREVLRAKPGALGVNYDLGNSLLMIGDGDEAIRAFKRETELDPKNSAAWWKLGVMTLHTDAPKARDYLERSVSLDPRRAAAVLAYGHALLLTGETEKAVAQFQRAVELNPALATPHYFLAKAYRSLGRNEEAKKETAQFESLKRKKSENSEQRLHAAVKSQQQQILDQLEN